MIPEIDIWRVADLMLKRYGDGLFLYFYHADAR
jgi:hypothetical protein